MFLSAPGQCWQAVARALKSYLSINKATVLLTANNKLCKRVTTKKRLLIKECVGEV